jgi:hypothetical protein
MWYTGKGSDDNYAVGYAKMPFSPPSVATLAADNITTSAARLNGNITSLGTAANVVVLFNYGTSSGIYTKNTTTQSLTAAGAFYVDLSGLAPNTTYYFRAVASGQGTAVGGELSFTTDKTPPQPITAVGGEVYPVNKVGLLKASMASKEFSVLWIGLALIFVIGGGILALRRWRT